MRERTVEALAALAFLCCAGPLAIHALAVHQVDPLLAALLVGMYAFVAGLIRFPIGAGYVVPSYVVLVPMLLLLPPGVVPLLTAAGLLLGRLLDALARRAAQPPGPAADPAGQRPVPGALARTQRSHRAGDEAPRGDAHRPAYQARQPPQAERGRRGPPRGGVGVSSAGACAVRPGWLQGLQRPAGPSR